MSETFQYTIQVKHFIEVTMKLLITYQINFANSFFIGLRDFCIIIII